jgi:GT2 family glycosyltransferase
MRTKPIHVVIPVLNRWEQTRKCLAHLQDGSFTNLRIIVVDHGSTDGTAAGLKTEYPDVFRVRGSSELWWTGATNLGIRTALEQGATLIMLLNNDCYVSRDTLETLVGHSTEHPAAIIAPVHRNLHSGEIMTKRGGTLFLLGFPTLLLPGKSLYKPTTTDLRPTALVMGGRGTLIPADIFKTIGLFNDIDLPHYWADHDFFLRCKKSGFAQYIAQGTAVDIDESTTSVASQLKHMTLRQFIDTFKDRRSHRNVRDLLSLFRLHYPIPGLYPVGVFLNMARYVLVYLSVRARSLFTRH